ncbi:hypothetical protein T4D_15205 [Trichinella pseudospiralis]|uniref:Uncharacterized protein n=1 Tax=Trichinella pseudospiralis TaxID=6337 RepID=A0A0V1DNB9_TRIPS|nr:hypothetical protein T4D_15205 [Trichinella pseudospiralis]
MEWPKVRNSAQECTKSLRLSSIPQCNMIRLEVIYSKNA